MDTFCDSSRRFRRRDFGFAMNLSTWALWRDAKGEAKKKLLEQILKENEPLAVKCAMGFLYHTSYSTDSLKDDVFQAARIGLIRALDIWRPEQAAFSTVAYFKMRHEMQQVIRHATPITRPKSADLTRKQQSDAEVFYALNGRQPEPEEIGVSKVTISRAEHAGASFIPLMTNEHVTGAGGVLRPIEQEDAAMRVETNPEEDIDRKRDMQALRLFLAAYPARTQKAFWSGRRPDLTELAREFIARRQSSKGKI